VASNAAERLSTALHVAGDERELVERGLGPHAGHVDPVGGGQGERFGGMPDAVVIAPLPGLQPRRTGKAYRQQRGLAELAGEPGRLAVVGSGARPVVGGGTVAGDHKQQRRESADG
jgi:hypothetical protein